MKKNTKIIATIGPACNNKAILQKMVDLGVNVFRLNMSHGNSESKQKLYELVKSIKSPQGKRPSILTDLAGPKIRVTNLKNELTLSKNQSIVITNEDSYDEKQIKVTKGVGFSKIIKGARILINDGKIQLEVIELISKHSLRCKTIIGGKVELGKGVNFPGIMLNVPTLTEQDKADLKMALNSGADWIALSFVRSSSDISYVHKIMDEVGKRLPIMGKIEKWEALNDLESIVKTFDGVMVARGDLGVEIPAAKVPLAQKEIIKLAGALGKPVVIATQLLESMIESQTPTRAEVSDVANAIFDGVDALLVTGETAIGKFPVEVIKTLNQVIQEVEQTTSSARKSIPEEISKTADAISHAVCSISADLDIKVIMSMTHSGSTARMISRYRPSAKILALTPFDKIVRQLQLIWGVNPIKVDNYDNVEDIPSLCFSVLKDFKLLNIGDKFVITGGVPMGTAGSTNYLSVQKL
jgi:pyruvate kinase